MGTGYMGTDTCDEAARSNVPKMTAATCIERDCEDNQGVWRTSVMEADICFDLKEFTNAEVDYHGKGDILTG